MQHLIVSASSGGEYNWELDNGGHYIRKPPRLINASTMLSQAVKRRLDIKVVEPPTARVTRFLDRTIIHTV